VKGNISFRIIIISLILLFAAWFLIPTYQWYNKTEEEKAMVNNELINPTISGTNTTESNIQEFRRKKTLIERLKKIQHKAINLGLDLQGGMHIVLQADTKKFSTKEKQDVMNRALEILRNRIDQFGVSEPSITRQGENRIVVQLPGVKDTKRAGDLIQANGVLNFKIVDDELSKYKNFADFQNGILKPEITLPDDEEILFLWKKDKDTGKLVKSTPLVVKKNPVLTGAGLKTAEVGFSQLQEAEVNFELKPEGSKIFAEVTGANIGKRLAIELDGKIRSAPVIRDKLYSRGSISGNFTLNEARDLALILRAGALPVNLEIVEERVVGPTLGADSIDEGVKAAWIGAALVVFFMLLFYKLSGFIADLGVIINLFLTLGILAGLHFTLTLPGIAGLILTIGMAVDANVIIFERIKEELAAGKTPVAAIAAGYDRAYTTIIDSNVTTLITSAVLFQFGTGPIKGFAVTMFIGISANLFTAIYITRTIYMILSKKSGLRRLSI